jgi:hypothetical protein
LIFQPFSRILPQKPAGKMLEKSRFRRDTEVRMNDLGELILLETND